MFKIAICNDAVHEGEYLYSMLMQIMEEHSILCKIKVYSSGKELLESEEQFHCIFLNVVMSGVDGIELGKSLNQINSNVKIIYITSFEEYCIDAVNHVHALSFVLFILVNNGKSR